MDCLKGKRKEPFGLSDPKIFILRTILIFFGKNIQHNYLLVIMNDLTTFNYRSQYIPEITTVRLTICFSC